MIKAQRDGDGPHETAHEAVVEVVEDPGFKSLERTQWYLGLAAKLLARDSAQLSLGSEIGTYAGR